MLKFKKEFDVCYDALKKASKAILTIYNQDFEVSYKSDNSEVTNADLKSNEIIKSLLIKNFPGYAILSEESKDNLERINNDYCWIIDPLDGTRDFVHRDDMFAINVALAYKHEIVFGMIAVPCKEIYYFAGKGEGAYKIENGIETRIKTSNKDDGFTMLISNFFFNHHEEYKNNPHIKELKPVGSSYKAGLIAEGKADFCIKLDNHSKEWDTAPIDIIIKEAGGSITDVHGNEMKYNKENFVNEEGFLVINKKENLDKMKK